MEEEFGDWQGRPLAGLESNKELDSSRSSCRSEYMQLRNENCYFASKNLRILSAYRAAN